VSHAVNWRQGFLRLWVVVSVLWLIVVSTFIVLDPSWKKPPLLLIDDLPIDHNICVYRDAQDVLHFTSCPPDAQTRGSVPLTVLPSNERTRVQKFDEFLAEEKQNFQKQRWELITRALPIAFGLPLALLFLGVAVSWIIRGFTAR